MPPVFHHDFDHVEDYLHQRSPYLMVSEIRVIHDDSIDTQTKVSGNEHYISGHFPGAAIVPGAMLQEMTTQSAGILLAARHNPMETFDTHDPLYNPYALGVLVGIKGARFRGFARPGDTLQTRVELVDRLTDLFEFRGFVTCHGEAIMSNRFQLANIPSALLHNVDTVGANSGDGK